MYRYIWASLVAQLVKNLPAMWETCVRSLGWEDALEREKLPTPVFWPGEFHGCIDHGVTKSQTWLSDFHINISIYNIYICLCAKSLQCLTLCDPPNHSSVHGILQGRILEWVAMSSSRVSSQPKDPICIFGVSCIGRGVLYPSTPREAHKYRLPHCLGSKESACCAGAAGGMGFDSCVRQIPWTRAWQPTPVFLPGSRISCTEEPGGLLSMG